MKLQIKLDNFEGPLELLIHLIEQKNINITEVKINDLINEYIIILEEAKRGNIEIKIEFLGIAIELLEIKAFSILNMREKERQEEKLIQKLTEYKLFKELSEEIRTYENEYNISHTKSDKPRQIKKIPNKKFETSNLNSESIFETYSKYIKKNEIYEIDLKIQYDLKIEKDRLWSNLKNINKKIKLDNIFSTRQNNLHLVYLFLAVLELYRDNRIDIIENSTIVIKNFEGV